jgi:transketolase
LLFFDYEIKFMLNFYYEREPMNDHKLINLLKGLILDGVDKARSGHPGGPLSAIDFAYILYTEFLRFDPENPKWMGRDRFVLSAGHASMLQYALLYAIGYLDLSELKRFRQWGSKTPGHPENYLTSGIECTTGPLGQGCAMSVGFAIAAEHLAVQIDPELFSNRTWVILGDGCLQEDVTLGAASLAGHLKLNKLIWFYDRNAIQISGSIDRATSDDEVKIFEGFGWHTISIDGHDHQAIRTAIQDAMKQTERPTLIIGHTQIARGTATMTGSAKTHGSPLPAEEYKRTRELLGLPADQSFYWTEEATEHFRRNFTKRKSEVAQWNTQFKNKQNQDPKIWNSYFTDCDVSKLPSLPWDQSKPLATRNAFGNLIETWYEHIPSLIGGSADLEPSNVLEGYAKKVGDYSAKNRKGRNLVFGVREFPMSAICNGIALYGGLIPFDATFLVFSDYSRPALRLGALQGARVIHEFTHDSFYLGEDGPTHQPIEHLMSLRMIPKLNVMRPADAFETETLLRVALRSKDPSCFALSRQNLPHIVASKEDASQAQNGAWIVKGKDVECKLIIFATGSEVSLACQVADYLEKDSLKVRVVSVPCWELFFQQPESYRKHILHASCTKRVSIEAGTTLGWERFVGSDGITIGIDHFGESAPAEVLAKEFGFTVDAVVSKIRSKFF